jgi:hypothetical protein
MPRFRTLSSLHPSFMIRSSTESITFFVSLPPSSFWIQNIFPSIVQTFAMSSSNLISRTTFPRRRVKSSLINVWLFPRLADKICLAFHYAGFCVPPDKLCDDWPGFPWTPTWQPVTDTNVISLDLYADDTCKLYDCCTLVFSLFLWDTESRYRIP